MLPTLNGVGYKPGAPTAFACDFFTFDPRWLRRLHVRVSLLGRRTYNPYARPS